MSIGDLEQEQRAAAGRVAAVQKQLGALAKDDPARGLLKTELEAGLGVPRVARRAPPAATHSAWSFVANVLRNFAGIGTPLHQACVARLPADVVAQLEARVAYVMDKVQDDLYLASARGFISAGTANEWRGDLAGVLNLQAVDFFELQFTKPGGGVCALRYTVLSDGRVVEDRPSGGFDLYFLPDGTTVGITIRLVKESPRRRQAALDFLKSRGWSFNGVMVDGDGEDDRSYSKEGFGVGRKKVGDWS